MKCRNPYTEATAVPPALAVRTIEVLEITVSMSMTASQATEGASVLIAECQPGETTGMITDSQAARLQASLDETLG